MTEPDEDLSPVERLTATERDPQAPIEDAVEQATLAEPDEEQGEVLRGLEVGEWDAVEQARTVGPDDDYR